MILCNLVLTGSPVPILHNYSPRNQIGLVWFIYLCTNTTTLSYCYLTIEPHASAIGPSAFLLYIYSSSNFELVSMARRQSGVILRRKGVNFAICSDDERVKLKQSLSRDIDG